MAAPPPQRRIPVPRKPSVKEPVAVSRYTLPRDHYPRPSETKRESEINRGEQHPKNTKIWLQYTPREGKDCLYNTKIEKLLVSGKQLPFLVKVTGPVSDGGQGSISFESGTILSLHFIYQTVRVYASDEGDRNYYLPTIARQLYEVLPMSKYI